MIKPMVKIDVTRLNRRLQRFCKSVEREVVFDLCRLGEDISDAAKAYVLQQREAPETVPSPLADSISVQKRDDCVSISATAPYAVFVELGTSKAPPEPFLQPAFDDVVGVFAQDLLQRRRP